MGIPRSRIIKERLFGSVENVVRKGESVEIKGLAFVIDNGTIRSAQCFMPLRGMK